MARWKDIPTEIVREILLLDDNPAHAAVCKKWQTIMEQNHFRLIQLTQNRISDFGQIVMANRRKLLEHVWLRIEFPTYEDPEQFDLDTDEELYANAKTYRDAITNLFTILSSWEKTRDLNHKGLTLELCAYSPSDTDHCLNGHNFAHDPYTEPPEAFRVLPIPNPKDMNYMDYPDKFDGTNPIDFDLVHTPNRIAADIGWYSGGYKGFHEEYKGLYDLRRLPEVEVVTKLLVRSQYPRSFGPEALSSIFKNLVGLEHVIFERPANLLPYLLEKGRVLDCLPNTLKQLTIFGCWEDTFIRINTEESGNYGFWRQTQKLEHLAASFYEDGFMFVEGYWLDNDPYFDGWWEKLETLALTAEDMKPNTQLGNPMDPESDLVNFTLSAAGNAAKRMPKLRVMEIWNGKEDLHGSIFRYTTDDESATITWQSSWYHKYGKRVINSWTDAMRKHTRHEHLRIEYEPLLMDGTAFPGSVLRHLKLKDRIVHPITYRQIMLRCAPRTWRPTWWLDSIDVTRSHKFNDKDHVGIAEGTAVPHDNLPKFFAKNGFDGVDPKKTKKNGGGKANWGAAGQEVVDENFNFSNARRRSNSSGYSNHKDFRTKFEINELEPVFDESLHGPSVDDDTTAALSKTETSSSAGSSADEKEQK